MKDLEAKGTYELARMVLIAERVRKHWRIIAIKAVHNLVNEEYLKGVCFREMLGIVPEEEELDAELTRLVQEIEQRENGATSILDMFGKEPRELDL